MIDFKVKLISTAVICSFLMCGTVSAKTISVQGTNNDLQRTVKASPSNSKPKNTLSNSSYQGEGNIDEILSEPSDNNIQPVPSSVMRNNNQQRLDSRMTVTIHSGENRLIPISVGQPNRIVTPFPEPVVLVIKKNSVKISKEGNVIYITSYKKEPIAMYITNKGDESKAISLSLHPEQRPPVEATLLLAKEINTTNSNYNNSMYYSPTNASQSANREKAERWEKSDTYAKTITKLLKAIALGDLPTGYEITDLKDTNVSIPNCLFRTGGDQDNIKYSFKNGQYIAGARFSVIVGVASNTGLSTVLVDESLCTHPRLAARALWSNNTLAPNQKTEAYFVIRNDSASKEAESISIRPRLAE
ncbi:type-F conjugative transfer system secretin TraK (plasmid) [Arsenophonus nasoniae]|uniref:Type-F conjugative transfer system secretin TraK n=2 Tax=Arsenophonus nasoniae TaxID=638 RepID=A0ABY8NWG6_9GAMM|nr:type-F conjugative transfer system secretin TraK [Arsenophonus nasoniae]WGM08392.1 type-F conjugative transfer system secretin TraK [Arsenophonus nasoniae]WGM13256.1 type-F conjugative transfer system secretin TraK [Arsenophonus nasoniae]WGM17827.1 type-F conjugative transfer system secretin TraK [Arsenophonus nasoniae]